MRSGLYFITLATSGIAFGATLFGCATSRVAGAELRPLLQTIREVQVDGKGSAQAADAWERLIEVDANELPQILAALDDAGPIAANWLRTAVDAIAERELAANSKLPTDALERFILNTDHKPRARRLAFDVLTRVDKSAHDRLIPGLLHDPSVEFRRDAVQRLLGEAEKQLKEERSGEAIQAFRRALDGARDKDQIDFIAKQLRDLEQDVDLPRHFGFLMHWHLVGPFDNTDRKGFAASYPPEQELDLKAGYEGKEEPVSWHGYSSEDDYGMVDLNQPFGKLKETVAYAWTDFTSDGERHVELRLGCKNAWKVWLNGTLVFERDEYHRGMRLDQYRMPVTLRTGRNDILVKACQNEEQHTWTVQWQFQLRVCDPTGTAVLSTTRP